MNSITRWNAFNLPQQQYNKLINQQQSLSRSHSLSITFLGPMTRKPSIQPKPKLRKSKKKHLQCWSYNFHNKFQHFNKNKQIKINHPTNSFQYPITKQSNKKQQNRQYSKKYKDLLNFMYKDQNKIPTIPNYQVKYDDDKQKNFNIIKNSFRRYKQNYSEIKENRIKNKNNNNIIFTNNIINNKYRTKLTSLSNQKSLDNNSNQYHQKSKKYRTIDFPHQSSTVKQNHQKIEKQQKIFLHRTTQYHRNMLGVLLAKLNNNKKYNQIYEKVLKDRKIDKKQFFKANHDFLDLVSNR